jgi:hypothetical protein
MEMTQRNLAKKEFKPHALLLGIDDLHICNCFILFSFFPRMDTYCTWTC